MAKSNKGPPFEREICKQLSLWWTQDFDKPDDAVFWRTSQSGGRATTRAKKNLKTAYAYGDVTFTNPIGKPFIDSCLVELKRGYTKDISVLDFLDKTKGIPILVKWWEKATDERHLAGRKYTVLIFRRDRHKQCIMISISMYNNLVDWFGVFSAGSIEITTKKYNLIILDLVKFLDWCNPDFFKIK